jgi:peptidoglycan/LPS O-acetylase OafA/YrhL
MSLTKRLVILAGLVGLMFYNASAEQLWATIIDYQLSWYKLGVPLAWGLILGALVNLIGLTRLDKWLEPLTFISASLTTLGLTGAAAIYAAHQQAGLLLPALMISAIGVGLYLFVYSFARFSAHKKDAVASKDSES